MKNPPDMYPSLLSSLLPLPPVRCWTLSSRILAIVEHGNLSQRREWTQSADPPDSIYWCKEASYINVPISHCRNSFLSSWFGQNYDAGRECPLVSGNVSDPRKNTSTLVIHTEASWDIVVDNTSPMSSGWGAWTVTYYQTQHACRRSFITTGKQTLGV